MNRYVADGILSDVMTGRVVLVVSENARMARHAFEEIAERAEYLQLKGMTTRRTNGQECVSHTSGGRVVAVTERGSGGRGMRVDVLYLDAVVSYDRLRDLMPALAVSPHGELIQR